MRACTTAISTTTAPRIPRHSLQTRTENFKEVGSFLLSSLERKHTSKKYGVLGTALLQSSQPRKKTYKQKFSQIHSPGLSKLGTVLPSIEMRGLHGNFRLDELVSTVIKQEPWWMTATLVIVDTYAFVHTVSHRIPFIFHSLIPYMVVMVGVILEALINQNQ
ncbi:hypothetical protein NC653_030631 [Populus alba x Populus x berolinensis]|uniref:Uncharacterized protein n=1 Tax=Populus alba x Populus x berolinensis TaxID=444605 RepID=A0AAD6LWF7_9ROSI|nr:hypothetical protein NC653_030631 [Populus alba x Populus x berolinensis]